MRRWVTGLLTDATERDLVEPHLVPLAEVTLHLPVEVADYVDFYASRDHATNVGRIFRPDGEPLLPNWQHLPGRLPRPRRHRRRRPARRSSGRAASARRPTRRPRRTARRARLDIEAELGFVVGTPSALGTPVPYDAFADHVFGVVGLNDWSARDIQAWEYVPLGPFLGKSFATSISHVGHAARGARRRLGRPARPGPGAARPTSGPGATHGPRHRRRGRAERRGRQPAAVPHDVLVARPDARPPDRQRRLAAHRRPLRLGHDQRPGAGPARLVPRDRLGRHEPFGDGRTSSRTATRSCSATPRPAPAAAGSRSARSPARIEPAPLTAAALAASPADSALWSTRAPPRWVDRMSDHARSQVGPVRPPDADRYLATDQTVWFAEVVVRRRPRSSCSGCRSTSASPPRSSGADGPTTAPTPGSTASSRSTLAHPRPRRRPAAGPVRRADLGRRAPRPPPPRGADRDAAPPLRAGARRARHPRLRAARERAGDLRPARLRPGLAGARGHACPAARP